MPFSLALPLLPSPPPHDVEVSLLRTTRVNGTCSPFLCRPRGLCQALLQASGGEGSLGCPAPPPRCPCSQHLPRYWLWPISSWASFPAQPDMAPDLPQCSSRHSPREAFSPPRFLKLPSGVRPNGVFLFRMHFVRPVWVPTATQSPCCTPCSQLEGVKEIRASEPGRPGLET